MQFSVISNKFDGSKNPRNKSWKLASLGNPCCQKKTTSTNQSVIYQWKPSGHGLKITKGIKFNSNIRLFWRGGCRNRTGPRTNFNWHIYGTIPLHTTKLTRYWEIIQIWPNEMYFGREEETYFFFSWIEFVQLAML